MTYTIDATWLLLFPFASIIAFCVWALWNFSDELRAAKRRRIRRSPYRPIVQIYRPAGRVVRIRRSHEKEAA